MTDRELRRLSRVELIRLLLEQTEESERLRQELEQAKSLLEDRRILVSNAGSIAEASLQINQVMEAAQKAADQYIENVQRAYQERAEKQYAQMLEEAQRKANDGGDG